MEEIYFSHSGQLNILDTMYTNMERVERKVEKRQQTRRRLWSIVRYLGFLLPLISLIAAGEASKQEMLMGTDY